MPAAARREAVTRRETRLRLDYFYNIRAEASVRKFHRMAAAAKSPARPAQGLPPSSPRLPSPPPLPELQLGPQSPSITATTEGLSLDAVQDDGAARRVRPGSQATDIAKGPPFVPLHQLESPFQLQEYLKSSYCSLTRDESSSTIKPITRETAMQLANPPIQQETGEPVDKNLWLYELCRFLVQRTNRLIVSFFAGNPPCSSQTCPEMRASEWQYLCAVHEPPKSCCAIDYCCHTLDWAANVLTSTRHFPSRLALGGDGVTASQSMKQLTNIFRRVYRIYAHAWFQHREAFWMLEQEEGLYKFFKTVSDAYNLIGEDNYTVPPEAEGEKEDIVDTPVNRPEMQIMRNETQIHVPQSQSQSQPRAAEREPEPTPIPVPATPPSSTTVQRRHRHTPSTGVPVAAIAEGEEEEEVSRTMLVSQRIQPEPNATYTNMLSHSPPKSQPKSPKPEMSIPIIGPKKDDIKAPEDPTPTPETHSSDPFSGSMAAGIEDAEPPTPLTAVESDKRAVSSGARSLMPSIQVDPTTAPPSYQESEETVSPGGGSIRTAGTDILSGIMAHQDHEEGSANDVGDSSVEATQGNQDGSPGHADKTEDDEEMGEITLTSATITIEEDASEQDEQPKPEKDATVSSGDTTMTNTTSDSKPETEKEQADGTSASDTPSGVV